MIENGIGASVCLLLKRMSPTILSIPGIVLQALMEFAVRLGGMVGRRLNVLCTDRLANCVMAQCFHSLLQIFCAVPCTGHCAGNCTGGLHRG